MDDKKLRGGLIDAVKKYDAVRCDTCRSVVPMSDTRKSRAFARGWPECCGDTMRLHVLGDGLGFAY